MFPTNTDLDGGFDIFGAIDAVPGFCKMRCIGERVKDILQQEGLQECEGSRSLARHLQGSGTWKKWHRSLWESVSGYSNLASLLLVRPVQLPNVCSASS
jgi:hypothetical protein